MMERSLEFPTQGLVGVGGFLGVTQSNSLCFSVSDRGARVMVADPELLFMCL